MDKQTHEYRYVVEASNEAQLRETDALRYRRLKLFLDTLFIMDKNKGAMYFTDGEEFDEYVDRLRLNKGPLTAKDITAHALQILEGQLTMTTRENRK